MAVLDTIASLPVAALRRAWGAETSADPVGWTPANPAWGQCAVTALVVQDLLGGRLLRAATVEASHYWNLLDDGTEVDLTREQFLDGFNLSDVELRERSYVLRFPSTRIRYELLTARLRATAGGADGERGPAARIFEP